MSSVSRSIDSFHKAVEGASSLGSGQTLAVSGLYGSASAYFLARTIRSSKKPMLAVLPENEETGEFSKDMEFFLGGEKTVFFPSKELLPFETESVHPEISAKRIEALHKILASKDALCIITSAATLVERVLPPEALLKNVFSIKAGAEYPREELLARFSAMGYSKCTMVEERGEVSVRGGIVDIFPPAARHPVRIEFFADEVESVRTFDISTQRSLKEITEVLLLPVREGDFSFEAIAGARERLLERAGELDRPLWEPIYNRLREGIVKEAPAALFFEKLSTLFDYIPEDAVAAIVSPSSFEAALKGFYSEIEKRKEGAVLRPCELYMDTQELKECFLSRPLVHIEPLRAEGVWIETLSNRDLRQDIAAKKDLSPLRKRLREWLDDGNSVYLTAHNRAQSERTRELLEEFGISTIESTAVVEDGKGPFIKIVEGVLCAGFRVPSLMTVVVTEEEIFGERVKRRPPPSRKAETFLTQLKDLSMGDFVVHTLHGLGVYKGLERISAEGVESDFLLIEYRGGDKLYLPAGRLDLVTKYHGVEGKTPALDKLGGNAWERRKKRVKSAVKEIAAELLRLYAERKLAAGHGFSPPGKLFSEFEAGFEYDETEDQARAIEEVLKDMGESAPMDRLVCGDVGYGKTEVAMRAAFVCSLDSLQTAVLVPTTVLAQQHYLTFKKRFAPFPVTVDVLSRFRTKKEEKEILENLAHGKIDIIIGTHRLLERDVVFKDLGLLIVDEEHRFGVRAKEKLKELKKGVDVLSLTATPIPRTLHMALSDARDLSIINTPPADRLSVVTRIIRFDDTLLREALERELLRGGQVFFVHNRIETIGAVFEHIRGIASAIKPDVRIAVGHGRMKEGELSRVMLGFANGECDILLSTSIVESGLDIPSANTIIIDRADRFGLAELYQLRGRVGRSDRRAYAYLISPEEETLTADARKRLEVLRELTELGSGFRIAAYDLEIRGAGELLGKAQAGHIAEVGFEAYAQLLEETVRELKGEKIEETPRPEANLKISLYIPEDYIPSTEERLGVYKRLATAKSPDDVFSLREELIDRYGETPVVAENLFRVAELKMALKKSGAIELLEKAGRLYLRFSKEPPQPVVEKILVLVREKPEKFRLSPDSRLIYSFEGDSLGEAEYLLAAVMAAPAGD